MAYLEERMWDHWDLTQSRRSLLLTQNLAIGKAGDVEPENIQGDRPALAHRLIMVPGGGYRAQQDSAVGLQCPTLTPPLHI